jgi:hypothetical protein
MSNTNLNGCHLSIHQSRHTILMPNVGLHLALLQLQPHSTLTKHNAQRITIQKETYHFYAFLILISAMAYLALSYGVIGLQLQMMEYCLM